MNKRNNLLIYQPLMLLAAQGETVAAGGAVIDRSGHGLNGTLAGDAYVNSSGINLDGTGDYVNCGNSSLFNFGSGAMSVAAWFKTNVSGTQKYIICKRDDDVGGVTPLWMLRLTTSNTLNANITGATYNAVSTSTGTYADNVWHHVVMSYASSVMTLYVDGALDNNASSSGTVGNYDSSDNVVIGASKATGVYGFLFTGSIADVRIYNRALSANEVLQLYNITNPYRV